ncbi:RNA polymerase sigma factor [Kitasatospora viridis]|uniref:DNA-directed RNA polymerase specialized sigma24 family protein n=1 Tax=Kitasatospora viridis TaxID=281105 RepID=A0A561TV39_9ACTN|nr:hypothetical protein [Kitasatospora viridis]TWF90977.1 hypothetical protein FHX73_1289 [Kitasatospora viridis]
MEHELAGPGGPRSASGRSIIRPGAAAEHGERLAALDEELVRAGGGTAGDRAARLAADAEVVRRLRQVGFAGPLYQQVMGQLMQYGWNVLTPWCGSGIVFAQARAAGRPVPESMIVTPWERDDRHEVATETILAGARLFHRQALVNGRWSPTGGASLTTFYLGACLLSFKGEYQRWHRSRTAAARQVSEDADEVLAALPDQRAVDPLEAVVLRSQVASVLTALPDPKLREALVLRGAGYSQAEAAHRVDLSTKALESRVGRARTKHRNDNSDSVTN